LDHTKDQNFVVRSEEIQYGGGGSSKFLAVTVERGRGVDASAASSASSASRRDPIVRKSDPEESSILRPPDPGQARVRIRMLRPHRPHLSTPAPRESLGTCVYHTHRRILDQGSAVWTV
jgi:hypothetical protein